MDDEVIGQQHAIGDGKISGSVVSAAVASAGTDGIEHGREKPEEFDVPKRGIVDMDLAKAIPGVFVGGIGVNHNQISIEHAFELIGPAGQSSRESGQIDIFDPKVAFEIGAVFRLVIKRAKTNQRTSIVNARLDVGQQYMPTLPVDDASDRVSDKVGVMKPVTGNVEMQIGGHGIAN